MYETNVFVLGGLEITVAFEPEWDGVIENFEIVAIAGRRIRSKESTAWLDKRLNAKKGENDRIFEACRYAI